MTVALHIREMEQRPPRGSAAILLIGGDKSPDDPDSPNWNRWYDHFVPIADDLYDEHLDELREEGLI